MSSGHDVIALVHDTNAEFPAAVEKRHADLMDTRLVTEILKDVGGVCHLAAAAQARISSERPALFYRVNVGGTASLLDAMAAESKRSGNIGRIVFASTGQVYGTPVCQPIRESADVRPANPYAASKAACEQLLGWQAAAGSVGATSLRIFNVAGAAARRGDVNLSRIIPKAVAVAMGAATHVDVNGDGTAVRDFVDVKDVARAFVQALHASEPGRHAIYNVGATPALVPPRPACAT